MTKVKNIKFACLLVLLLCETVAGQDLPPEVLADSYLIEATMAIESGDLEASLQAFRKAEVLDVKPLSELTYAYGKAQVEHTSEKAWREGLLLLKKFIIETGRSSEFYTPALRLLLTAEAKLKEAELKLSLEERLPEIRRRISTQMVRVEGGQFTMGAYRSRCSAAKTKNQRTA